MESDHDACLNNENTTIGIDDKKYDEGYVDLDKHE